MMCDVIILDRDVVALLESVSDEFASIDDETREGDPEGVMREHLDEGSLLVEDCHVENDADDNVQHDSHKENDQEDACTVQATPGVVGNLLTTGCRSAIAECVATVSRTLCTTLKVASGGLVTDKIDKSTVGTSGSPARFTASVDHHKTLTGKNSRIIRRKPCLSLKEADDACGEEGCADTDAGFDVVAVKGGVAAEVHKVLGITVFKGHGVGLSVLVPDSLEVVLVRLLDVLVVDNGHAVKLRRGKNTQNNTNKKKSLHGSRIYKMEKKREKRI